MWSKDSPDNGDNAKLLSSKPKSYYTLDTPKAKDVEEALPLKPNYEREPNRNGMKEEKPDGGWGWLVVFGVALSNNVVIGYVCVDFLTSVLIMAMAVTVQPMTTQSLISVFGLLFLQRLEDLGITTQGASVMMGVQMTALNLSGLITGPVIKKYSYRKASVVGASLVVAGLLLTTHADTLPEFVFTYSLFTGLGLGLLFPATFVAIDSYFSSHRGRAVGLSVTGTGIGQMFLPLLVEFLLDRYDFNGTLLILAGLASHSFLGAALYQPIKWHMKLVPIEGNKPEETKLEAKGENAMDAESRVPRLKKPRKRGLLSRMSGAINLELLKSLSFVNLLVGSALVYSANMCFSMLLPFFLESIEYSTPNIALCMSVLSGADIIGRLLVPVFTDGFKMKSKTIFFVGALLSAIARSALVWPTDFYQTLLLASACGIVRAALICNFNLSVSEQTEPEKLPSALGLQMIFKGIAMMAFAPLIGFVRDYTKSYALCMHILSVFFLVLPFLAWLVEFIYTKCRKN